MNGIQMFALGIVSLLSCVSADQLYDLKGQVKKLEAAQVEQVKINANLIKINEMLVEAGRRKP